MVKISWQEQSDASWNFVVNWEPVYFIYHEDYVHYIIAVINMLDGFYTS